MSISTAKAQRAIHLAGTGVHAGCAVHANFTAPALTEAAISRREGHLSADGALMVRTGVHTGRSPRDKFVVDEPGVSDDIWWGSVNKKLPQKNKVVKKPYRH